MIELRALTVLYGRTLALDSLTLQLHEGVTGVFGPNGSGKSTLLRVLAGLLAPTSGTVLIDGRPIRYTESMRRRIGYAGHETGLYARLSVEENLSLFALLYGRDRERVSLVLEQLGLSDRAETPAGELSAGLKRRAAVARALLHEPQVLILDEPYANLDDDAAALVSAAVEPWNQPGRMALIATHGAKKVKRFAGAGLILRRGSVVVHGAYGPRQAVTSR